MLSAGLRIMRGMTEEFGRWTTGISSKWPRTSANGTDGLLSAIRET